MTLAELLVWCNQNQSQRLDRQSQGMYKNILCEDESIVHHQNSLGKQIQIHSIRSNSHNLFRQQDKYTVPGNVFHKKLL